MPLLLQDDSCPGIVLDALLGLVEDPFDRIRIAVAYTTMGGSQLLVPRLVRQIGVRDWEAATKTIVTSIDYGITDPEALEYWADQPRTTVLVANADLLARQTLRPTKAFHPKLYLFSDGRGQSYLMGSANLTRKAFTVNREVVIESRRATTQLSDGDWNRILSLGTPLSEEVVREYRLLREANPPQDADEVPGPVPVPLGNVPVFYREVEAGRLIPGMFTRFWVQAGAMSTGGSHNILEVPRYANRFFGFDFDDYGEFHILIGNVRLSIGRHHWVDRQLAWHGAERMNKMERLTLPTIAQGGVDYAGTAVMFRRLAAGYEMESCALGKPVGRCMAKCIGYSGKSVPPRRTR